MIRRINFRLLFVAVVLVIVASWQIAREYRPSFLKPGLHLYAYVANGGDGTVSVVDLVSLSTIATIPVGPHPSGLRAQPARKEIWGVSTDGGYVWVIDATKGNVVARIPVGAAPFALEMSRDGKLAYVAAS